MKFGIVGLGRMGGNLARQAMGKGHQVVGFSQDHAATLQLASKGMQPAESIPQLTAELDTPRVVLLYVPHGAATEAVCQQLRPQLQGGDVVVDGGNSHWQDSIRHHGFFSEAGVGFLDVGRQWGAARCTSRCLFHGWR